MTGGDDDYGDAFKEAKLEHDKRRQGSDPKAFGLPIQAESESGIRRSAPEHVGRKGNTMQVPSIVRGESLTRLLQGAAAGAVATMIIGFNWGGWTLGSTAEKQVKDAEQASIVRVLAPICADKFQHSADAGTNLEALKKTDSWNRDELIEKAGWATFPGSEPDRHVGEACANLLSQTK